MIVVEVRFLPIKYRLPIVASLSAATLMAEIKPFYIFRRVNMPTGTGRPAIVNQ